MQRILSLVILCLGAVIVLSSCFGSGQTVNYAAKEEEKTFFNNLSESGWFELYKRVGVDAETASALKDKTLKDLSVSEKEAFEKYRAEHAYYLDIKEEKYDTDGKTAQTRKVYVVKELVTGTREKVGPDGNPVYQKVTAEDGTETYEVVMENVYEGGKPVTVKGEDGNDYAAVYVEMSDLGLKFVDDPDDPGKKTLATLEVSESKGFLYYILMPVGKFLNLLNGIVPSYILTLFIFAILVKVLLFWFGIKQQKSMVKQANFKPKEYAIRNSPKYKGRTDRATQQQVQQEIMEAQKAEGVSAFGGCLPMLIQLPIILILYQVIINPLQYVAGYSANLVNGLRNVLGYNSIDAFKLTDAVSSLVKSSSIGRISELNLVPVLRDNWAAFHSLPGMAENSADALPNFYAFGSHVDLSVTPDIMNWSWPAVLYLLIPVITFVALFFSMKINRKLTGVATQPVEGAPDVGAANKIMDLVMPVMSTVFTFMFPALLGIYWIFNNLLGTVQQLILNKMIPLPVFTEEDFKRAEREYNGKEPKKKQTSATVSDPNRPKGKSLHHIDDDDEDYPDLPPIDEDREPVRKDKEKGMKAKMKDDKPSGKDADDGPRS